MFKLPVCSGQNKYVQDLLKVYSGLSVSMIGIGKIMSGSSMYVRDLEYLSMGFKLGYSMYGI